MKIELVDKRQEPAAPAVPIETLAALVTPLGRPEWTVDLVLVDDALMTDLYENWYGGEGVTDVLSFSYLEAEGNGRPALAGGEASAACDLWLSPTEETDPTIGEIVLAPRFVAARCKREGWDLATEWALLLVHGVLHVLGWRHGEPAQRAAMRAREAEVLAGQGFAHPLPDESTGRS
jgi:probable rRNA maturation factor